MTTDTVHQLLAELPRLGFTHDPDTGYYDLDTTRVSVDDQTVIVYRFTDAETRNLEWRAAFYYVPAQVVLAVAQAGADNAAV